MSEAVPLPQSPESERALLGGLLLDGDKVETVADIVRPDDFFRPAHGRLFKLLVEMSGSGAPVELASVAERALATKIADSLGGISYIAELSNEAPSTLNLGYYAEQVSALAQRRRLIESLERALEEARDTSEELPVTLSRVENGLMASTRATTTKGWRSAGALAVDLVQDLRERAQSPSNVAGIATGYRALDGMLKGFRPHQLVILAGRPGSGKTSLAMNIAEGFADRGHAVGVYSMEMSGSALTTRLLAGRANVPLGRLLNASLSSREWVRLRLVADSLGLEARWDERGALQVRFSADSGYPLYVDESPGLTMSQVRQRARRLKAEHPDLALIVVDYIQLMGGSHRGQPREQVVAENARGLKNLAKELNVTVLGLSQLNRQVEGRPNKRPQLSDLRESGEVEQAADVVAAIYRDDYYNKMSTERGIAEAIILKQRDGDTGTVKLWFEGQFCRFENLSF